MFSTYLNVCYRITLTKLESLRDTILSKSLNHSVPPFSKSVDGYINSTYFVGDVLRAK